MQFYSKRVCVLKLWACVNGISWISALDAYWNSELIERCIWSAVDFLMTCIWPATSGYLHRLVWDEQAKSVSFPIHTIQHECSNPSLLAIVFWQPAPANVRIPKKWLQLFGWQFSTRHLGFSDWRMLAGEVLTGTLMALMLVSSFRASWNCDWFPDRQAQYFAISLVLL